MSQGITYETAKKLKDAGFPQQSDYGYTPKRNIVSYHRSVPTEEDVRIPSLSELIEECGLPIWIEGSTLPEFAWMAGRGKGMDTPLGRGPTPEEAVAKLWLALHPITNSKEEV